MIPIRLSIEGIYSYRQRQEIDFTRLTDAQLFGIFGATGSGKSTILEAISFALYGETERLNQRENRAYNMMNLKSDRLFIDFVFESGGDQYKFTVSGKRQAKRFDKIDSLERKAFRIEGAQVVALAENSAESILGLSYDNFKRTIIIPQGQFQDFLQLTDTERTRMLKEIFQLERFELYEKTASLEKKNQDKVARQESLLSQLGHASLASLEALRQQLAEAEQNAAQLIARRKQEEKQLAAMDDLKALFERIAQQQQLVQGLSEQAERFREREAILKEYELCLLDFKPHILRRKELTEEIDRLQQSVSLKKETREQTEKDLEKSERSFRDVEKNYTERHQLLDLATDLETILKLRESQTFIRDFQDRILKGEKLTSEKQSAIESLREEQNQLTISVRELRDQRPKLTVLMELRGWFEQYRNLKSDTEKLEQELTLLRQNQSDKTQEKYQLLRETPLDSSQFDLPSEKILALLRNRSETLATEIREKEQQLRNLLVQQHLHDAVRDLREGEPCPLCGATDHPFPLDIVDNESFSALARQQVSAFTQEKQQTETIAIRIEGIAAAEALLSKQLQSAQNRLLLLQSETDKHEAAFVWQGYRPDAEAQVHAEIEEIKRIDIEIANCESRREVLDTALAEQEKLREKYRAALDDLRKQLQEREKRFESLRGNLRQTNYEAQDAKNDKTLGQEAASLRESYSKIESLWEEHRNRIRLLQSNLDMLRGELSELEKRGQENTQKLAQLVRQIQERLQQSPFDSIARVDQILGLNLDVEAEKQAIQRYRQESHSADQLLAELKAQAGNRQFDPERYLAQRQEIEQLLVQIETQTMHIGALRTQAERLEQDLARRREVEAQLETLQLRAEDLRTLKNLFRNSGFVNYVSTIFLQNLCLSANHRFSKLTRGALQLETAPGNAFVVRDYLNNGQTRSVKTLSGGQTFQASLSLALALSDQIQKQAQSNQNFFFLDEGFGSQDKQSLQLIFETLKSLRRENRIVGIISHVEELQQEIDTHLVVVNDTDRGSMVRGSWE
ncbi:MAG: SMC family ATPase [Bacteroidetes bacterium]|nr:MAG: SMC family ATPase [Bacteroidota bacterium]